MIHEPVPMKCGYANCSHEATHRVQFIHAGLPKTANVCDSCVTIWTRHDTPGVNIASLR